MTNKQLTIDGTWRLCLQLWRWVIKQYKLSGGSIAMLKIDWFDSHWKGEYQHAHCFFCEYNGETIGCNNCPGALVDPSFRCWNEGKHYMSNPIEFFEELKRLNKKRLEMQKGAKR